MHRLRGNLPPLLGPRERSARARRGTTGVYWGVFAKPNHNTIVAMSHIA